MVQEDNYPHHHILNEWVKEIKGVIPPFCVELVLKSGSRFFLHSVIRFNKDTNTSTIRVWDLRAMNEDDISELQKKLNSLDNRKKLEKAGKVHPKLDWANMRLSLDSVEACVEWHDRLWPENERPVEETTEVQGFTNAD